MSDKPKRKVLANKEGQFIQVTLQATEKLDILDIVDKITYIAFWNKCWDEMEAYYKPIVAELRGALTVAKEWIEKDVVERGFKKLILAKSPVIEALSILEKAIANTEQENGK